MRLPKQPLFLARTVYRKRRLRDAARMLPIFGFVLMMLPMLWPHSGANWVYLFGIWVGLIASAAILAKGLGSDTDETRPNRDLGGEDAL